ncbi:MAG TPA: transcriptional repressor [Salinivirgaceae bacterium]|nr:transcriptional repressor [Salinivirgaceae bacterium]
MENQENRKIVREMFAGYLEAKGYRKTPERFAIVDTIYSHERHFDVESLYVELKNKNYRVSRATIYNTIDLLTEARLLIKHQFGDGVTQFEKVFNSRKHDHMICLKCGKITEFYDARVEQLKQEVSEKFQFQVSSHVLYLHGICSECQLKENK